MDMYKRFKEQGIITDQTVIALHDTNLHYAPYNIVPGIYIQQDDGYAHQWVERKMVNIFNLHTTRDKHDEQFPFRHGITICQKFNRLN